MKILNKQNEKNNKTNTLSLYIIPSASGHKLIPKLNSLLFISSIFSMCFVRLHPGLKRVTTVLLHNNNYAGGEQVSVCACTHNNDTCVELRFDMLVLSISGDASLHVLAENDKAGVSLMLAGCWTLSEAGSQRREALHELSG